MHANAQLLQRLFTSLNQHDHEGMAACYHLEATFTDIAFDLRGRRQIHAMWAMTCQPEVDIKATFNVVHADDLTGQVSLVDDYTFRSTGHSSTAHPVHNAIDSRFRFKDGLVIEQRDVCDPHAWAALAIGGVRGFLAGRFRILRSFTARQMLQEFINKHAEYW